MFTVALHGDLQHMTFGHWAWLRFIDTLIGLAIAFLAYYLVITLPEVIRARRATDPPVQPEPSPPGDASAPAE